MGVLTILLGYLVGTFPAAYFYGKKILGKDIRRLGDGNMGARNAYHELGHKAGITIFFIDVAKGLLAILIARLSDVPLSYVLATGIAAVIGHNFPFFLQFRGGRGEATTIGILYALLPLPSLIVTIPTVLSLFIWKNVILTSAVCFISMPVVCWIYKVPGYMIIYALVLPILVAVTHYFRARALKKTLGTGTT